MIGLILAVLLMIHDWKLLTIVQPIMYLVAIVTSALAIFWAFTKVKTAKDEVPQAPF